MATAFHLAAPDLDRCNVHNSTNKYLTLLLPWHYGNVAAVWQQTPKARLLGSRSPFPGLKLNKSSS